MPRKVVPAPYESIEHITRVSDVSLSHFWCVPTIRLKRAVILQIDEVYEIHELRKLTVFHLAEQLALRLTIVVIAALKKDLSIRYVETPSLKNRLLIRPSKSVPGTRLLKIVYT